MKTKNKFLIAVLVLFCFASPSLAQDEGGDIAVESLWTNVDVIAGQEVSLYAKVLNLSDKDLLGTVKFFDSTNGNYVGFDQQVSIVAGGTDEVFVSWSSETLGNNEIAVRVVPWESNGDDPNNNKIVASIFVDIDSDQDGIPNQKDPDDDNDGVDDAADAFPLDASETADVDGDGTGDNADKDDDNDGVIDLEDVFPLDPNESKDSDKDGIGDNADAFPEDPDEWEDKDEDGVGANSDIDDNNKPPQLHIEVADLDMTVRQPIEFDASKSIDIDGEIKSFRWYFGNKIESNGQTVDEVLSNDYAQHSGNTISHEFDEAGLYPVILFAVDDKGEVNHVSTTVTITNPNRTLLVIIIALAVLGGAVMLFIYRFKRGKKK